MSGRSTFTAFVDEAGDEGFKLDGGSSRWLVLSAAVVRTAIELEQVKVVDRIRVALDRKDREPLHFYRMKHLHRLVAASHVAELDLRWVSVFCDKQQIEDPSEFNNHRLLYFHLSRLLLERVSWFCRDDRAEADVGNGSVRVVFSNRSNMRVSDFKVYMERLRDDPACEIEWSVLDVDAICASNHHNSMGLQVADVVASACYAAVHRIKTFTEPRYAELLLRNVYEHSGRRLRYGLKFWPPEAERAAEEHEDEESNWLRKRKAAGPWP